MNQNPQQTSYVQGDWNAICDRCGFSFKASELVEDWKGLRVCKKDWEPRHPQDFVRPRTETITPPWVRVDTLDDPTVQTGNIALSASLTDLLWYFDTTGGVITVTLPPAAAGPFNRVSVVYSLNNQTGPNNLTVTSLAAIVGSTTVLAGQTAYFQNDPINNVWRRL